MGVSLQVGRQQCIGPAGQNADIQPEQTDHRWRSIGPSIFGAILRSRRWGRWPWGHLLLSTHTYFPKTKLINSFVLLFICRSLLLTAHSAWTWSWTIYQGRSWNGLFSRRHCGFRIRKPTWTLQRPCKQDEPHHPHTDIDKRTPRHTILSRSVTICYSATNDQPIWPSSRLLIHPYKKCTITPTPTHIQLAACERSPRCSANQPTSSG